MSDSGQPPQRDMVYCHQCENEWYRDEYGLTCPECHSDFTEIIEPQHDPRDEHLPDLEPPGSHDDHGEFYDVPDPDEDDIGGVQWQQTGPGQMHGTFNRTYHFGGGQQGGQGQGLMGLFGSLLGGALSGPGQHPGQQQQAPQQQHQPQDEQRPQTPTRDQGARAASAPGTPRSGTTVRHYRTPLGHMTIASSSTVSGDLFPRNANQPQPMQAQPQGMDDLMNMFFNIGAVGPGGHMMGGGPMGGVGGQQPFMGGPGGFGNLFQMFGGLGGHGGGGAIGDVVFSQEDLDRVITQLMEQHQSGNAPGPASEAAIKALPTRLLEKSDLGDNSKADCSICMDEVNVGDTVTVLPCTHWFHGDCIRAWLSEHDTCPHCRQASSPPESQQDRRSSSTPASPRRNSGMFQRMRDAFGSR